MGSHRGVFAWYLALWLVLALAPAAYALFGAAVDVGGMWRRLCEIVLTPASVEVRETIRRPRSTSAPSGFGTPVVAREDDWLTRPVRPLD